MFRFLMFCSLFLSTRAYIMQIKINLSLFVLCLLTVVGYTWLAFTWLANWPLLSVLFLCLIQAGLLWLGFYSIDKVRHSGGWERGFRFVFIELGLAALSAIAAIVTLAYALIPDPSFEQFCRGALAQLILLGFAVVQLVVLAVLFWPAFMAKWRKR